MKIEHDHVYYLHLRAPKFLLGRQILMKVPKEHGGVTVAYRVRALGDELSTLDIGLARCRPDEAYMKRAGRDAALKDLLEAGPYSGSFEFAEEKTHSEIQKAITDDVLAQRNFKRNLRGVLVYVSTAAEMNANVKTEAQNLQNAADYLRKQLKELFSADGTLPDFG